MAPGAVSRRAFVTAAGGLVVSFAMPAAARAGHGAAGGPQPDQIDSWLAVGGDGIVTVFTGKVELGTGVQTALAQLVAEELDVGVEQIRIVQGDTDRVPDQGPTVGSKTIQVGGWALRRAGAAARHTLLGLAAARLGTPLTRLTARNGVISVVDEPARRLTYGELIGDRRFHQGVAQPVALKRPEEYRVVGMSAPRVDIPGKVVGTHTYLQDLRLDHMLHGRVVRPTSIGATLVGVDERSIRHVPGVVAVVRKGNFVGIVAEREEQAIRAARELTVTWRDVSGLPEMRDLHRTVRATPSRERILATRGDVEAALRSASQSLRATYHTPFHMHGSIGPSCGLAAVRDDQATVWTASQGVFELQPALAQLLGLPLSTVNCIFVEAAGCYGHNGADDAAADAALLSQAVRRPVRVQWMRSDEHVWEPKGPAMVMDVRGGLAADGQIVAWAYDVWTPTHNTRPARQAANTLAGQLTGLAGPRHLPVGGDRNARHPYMVPAERVAVHDVTASVLRPSALRGLGALPNTFANESFMDELAASAGADPVRFRLRHLRDPRAIAVIETVARLAGWQPRPSPRGPHHAPRGRGVAWAQYENAHAYVAVVVEVDVDRRTAAVRVVRAWVAHDCGLIVNPDGLRNQIEGNVIQSLSRALKEEVVFDRAGVTSRDWASYPILTFQEIPETIEIELINRPDQPSSGAGEPTACPVPAAVANAIYDATGVRLRTMPFTPDRLKRGLS